MTINTGVYIPGHRFVPDQVVGLVGNQLVALRKGAYGDKQGVKQRVVIVEDDEAKVELQRMLGDVATFSRVADVDAETAAAGRMDVHTANQASILSGRVITAGEYNTQKQEGGYCLQKLYIEALSRGCTVGAFGVFEPKEVPLKKGFITGAATGLLASAACKLAGASGSTILKGGVAAAALGFGWGYISQSRKPDIEDTTVTTQDMAKTLDHKGLQCADIRILSYSSGDRSELYDITDPHDRQRARTTPADKLALDESMASAIAERHPHGTGDYAIVQGYQGACGYLGSLVATQGHITRRSRDMRQDPPVEKEVRQSAARVQTVIWP